MGGAVQHHFGRGRLLDSALSLQRPNGLLQPAEIEVESYGLSMTRLLRTQQIAGAPELEIPERDSVPRAQIGMMLEDPESFLRFRVDRVRHQQVTVCPPVTPPHPAPQLIELG